MKEFKKKSATDGQWEFWIDVGGTFTDCLARDPEGAIHAHKLLSSGVYHGAVQAGSAVDEIVDTTRADDPDGFFAGYQIHWSNLPGAAQSEFTPSCVRAFNRDKTVLKLEDSLPKSPPEGLRYTLRTTEEAPVTGIRWLLGKGLGESVGPVTVRLGTTKGTNALLERQGARTVLVTTRGFRDTLRIAYQNRPRLFDLRVSKPEDLYGAVVEIDERLDREGAVLREPQESAVREQLAELADAGFESLAVCFLHSYRNGSHERIIRRVASEMGFAQVSLSSELNPLPKIVARGDTTVVDAYLTPILRNYLKRISASLPDASIQLMTSAGSLVAADSFVGKDSILSGPAGGVVGAARFAATAGSQRIVGFDMGGTSTDVCRFDGEYERRYEMELTDKASGGAIRVSAPMLSVETVAAGGGSICWFDGQKPVVGPRSAGADPGPACYGQGGPLTITDVNFHLGRVTPDRFPFPLDAAAVERRLDDLIDQIRSVSGQEYSRDELAEGLVAIANANMTAPIKKISVARGYDVREYSLVSYGGAGSQHACAVAEELGIREILCSRHAGALSALGIGLANIAKFGERAIGLPAEEVLAETSPLENIFEELTEDLTKRLVDDGAPPEKILPPRRRLDMRYFGQDARITVAEPADGDYCAAFTREHQRLYGFTFPDRPIEIYAARLELAAETATLPDSQPEPATNAAPSDRVTIARFQGASLETGVYLRGNLRPGDEIAGPAIIAEDIATIVVEPEWTARVNAQNDIVMRHAPAEDARKSSGQASSNDADRPDPIELELFNNHFASIAELMGATLEKTALSTNVKERLDFSCAIFTPEGDLVVNAPHIPVHLGAMSECVKCLREDVGRFRLGDVYVTNDPYRGGSHLPDVTVITPVFLPDAKAPESIGDPSFLVASRAHHSEIGGATPGSMPPFSRNLAEEGVLIRRFQLAADGVSHEDDLRALLASGPFPSRSIEENIADINAQTAANQIGVALLEQMSQRHGSGKVQAYMRHIQRAAENMMRAALLKLPEGERCFVDKLDNGARIAATVTIAHSSDPQSQIENQESEMPWALVDFTGTGPVIEGNLNANPAIVMSALIYCFRCLIEDDIPLNAGVLAPIRIKLPDNCLLNPTPDPDPARCPAVVGGNVETSQRVVDTVLGALGIVAASQGTMNNFLFGRSGEKAFGYYETICGGAGAGPDFDGAHAVHTHMTNTRLTDPEVLEARYPVRLIRCEIRTGSGGAGRHPGGDGLVREIEFLEPVEVSLLTNRRTTRPYGASGGNPGQPGKNLLRRGGEASFHELPSAAQFKAEPGDVLRLETPGGGGFGKPENPDDPTFYVDEWLDER